MFISRVGTEGTLLPMENIFKADQYASALVWGSISVSKNVYIYLEYDLENIHQFVAKGVIISISVAKYKFLISHLQTYF